MALVLKFLNRLVMIYGAYLPHHRGKWRVVAALIDWLKLERVYRGKIYNVDRGGISWKLNPECLVHRTILYEGGYEPRESRWLSSVVRPGWKMIDVGANIGYFSMLVEKLSGGTADIYSFEPLGENFEYLNENRRLNAFDRIRTYNMALGDRETELAFSVPSAGNTGQGRILVEGENVAVDGLIERVRVTTLDAFVEENGISGIDFIKMDVEGAEALVLAGARSTILRDRPLMMIEINPEALGEFQLTGEDLIARISELGYDLFTVEPGQRLEPLTAATDLDPFRNAICFPKERATSERGGSR